MALFKREVIVEEKILTKNEILELILEKLDFQYPHWHYIYFDETKFKKQPIVWDLLLIKNYKASFKKCLNPTSPNPVTNEKEDELQIVIAISIDINQEFDHDKMFAVTKNWVKHHLIIDDVNAVFRVLKKIEENYGNGK
jgi:hypothetical protein